MFRQFTFSLAVIFLLCAGHVAASPADLRATAHEYYQWRDAAYPVATSDQGQHRYDSRLTDYRMSEILRRREHVRDLLAKVNAVAVEGWSKDDRIDRILFQSQLAGTDFFGRQLDPESSDPQLYVNECSNAIFSLLKKDYAAPRTRGLAATARLEQMPALLRNARTNLTHPVKLYASLAVDAARGGDELYTVSLMTLADGMSSAEHKRLVVARDAALKALHEYADWLQAGLSAMPDWQPMGEPQYNYLLKHVLLLPFDAHDVAHLGEVELARYRALEAMLKDPTPRLPRSATRRPRAQGPGGVPRRLRVAPEGDREFPQGQSAGDDSGLRRRLRDPRTAGRVQAHRPRRLHESAGHLRQGPGRVLLHPDLQPRTAATSTSARRSRIRARSWRTRASPGTSCSSPSPTTCPG